MEETKWIVDKAHSGIEFSIRHMMISTVRGKFKDFDTEITGNPDDFDTVKGRFRISVASIDTGNPDRDNHLRSDDLFASEKFQDITFVSRKVNSNGGDLEVVGDLTIRGITKEVTLKGENSGVITDPFGNLRFGLTASAAINRQDFGVKWNMVLEGGGLMVGDKVNLSISIEAFSPKN